MQFTTPIIVLLTSIGLATSASIPPVQEGVAARSEAKYKIEETEWGGVFTNIPPSERSENPSRLVRDLSNEHEMETRQSQPWPVRFAKCIVCVAGCKIMSGQRAIVSMCLIQCVASGSCSVEDKEYEWEDRLGSKRWPTNDEYERAQVMAQPN